MSYLFIFNKWCYLLYSKYFQEM